MPQTFVKRPTSPLHFECLEALPEDILWPGSDDEADEDELEKKRLRIEILGKQYLEGKPLFIQTAGLRGPFHQGWINPWARERKYHNLDLKRFPQISEAEHPTAQDLADLPSISVSAKRRSLVSTEVDHQREKVVCEEAWEEPRAKRRRHEEDIRPIGPNAVDVYEQAIADLRDGPQNQWLKRDRSHAYSRSREENVSPTPTPKIRPTRREVEAPQLQKSPPRHRSSYEGSRVEGGLELDEVPVTDSGAINEIPINKGPQEHAPGFTMSPAHHGHVSARLPESPGSRPRQLNSSKSREERLPSRHGGRRLSREDQRRALAFKEKLFKAKKPTTASPSREPQGTEKPMTSRLAPYVSDIVYSEAATSAGLRAAAQGDKPSPHTTRSSMYLPEFHYRYQKEISGASSPERKQDSPKPNGKPSIRARSVSTSSSGSSDFAEAFEAAQAQATSGSLVSSYSLSPMIGRPETKSIKKNTKAMRRLTFTSSGEPRVAESLSSSRRSSNSSACASAILQRRSAVRTEKSEEDACLQKASTKSSDKSLNNGIRSRNSDVLPEAQVVSDKPAQLIQIPSGPSTDLMETDKQSPAFVSLGEEDSYFDMSTQAALLKAQSAFHDDLISPLKVSPNQFEGKRESLLFARPDKTDVTPTSHGHPRRAANHSIVKPLQKDEVEPMSTQEIADGISPFALTTIKKRPPTLEKRTSFALSPIRKHSSPIAPNLPPDPSPTFRKPLSMATTPSNSQPKPTPPIPLSRANTTSKPPSSSTSFSMLPNGTLPETSVLQDGQQTQQNFDISLPPDPFSAPFASTANGNTDGDHTPSSWDMEAAIEEAGSFLGNWDVEAEVRKKGGLSNSKKNEDLKGILSRGKRSS